MELLDVLDENGNLTGIVKDKKDVYKESLWHRSIHVWILNDKNELLLQKRNPRKETFPNLWAISVAGHVRSGEISVEAALRELKEEIHMIVKPEELELLFTVKRIQDTDGYALRVIDDIYLLRANVDIEHVKLQRSELTELQYIAFDELEKRFIMKDATLVPMTEENVKLFEILHKRFD